MYLSNVYVLANIRILTVEESYGTLEDWAARCFKFSSSGEYSIPDYVAKTSKDIKNADRETEAKELKDRLNAINLGYLIQPKNKKKFEASKAVVAYIFCSQIDDKAIYKNFKALSLLFHPDKDTKGEYTEIMKFLSEVKTAYGKFCSEEQCV